MSDQDDPELKGMGIVRKRRSRRILQHRTTTNSTKSQAPSAAASAWGDHLSTGAFDATDLPSVPPGGIAAPKTEVPVVQAPTDSSVPEVETSAPIAGQKKTGGSITVLVGGFVVLAGAAAAYFLTQ